MNAVALLCEARRLGACLEVRGTRLVVEAPAPLPSALVAELRAHKGELLLLLSSNDANLDREGIAAWWAERAAIMEFDGGLQRDDAEREAWLLVSARYRLH